MSMLRARPDIELVEGLSFTNVVIRNGKVYHNDFCLNDLDLFFWYANIGREWNSYDIEVLKTLALDIPVVGDPFRLERGLDKFASHQALKQAGVRVADSMLFNFDNLNAVEPVMKEWGEVVLKPRRGAFGIGVTFIDDFATLRDAVSYIHGLTNGDPDGGYLIERFYSNNMHDWASVTMLHGEIMYGYHKQASKITDVGNGQQKVYDDNQVGGDVDLYPLNDAQKREAHKAWEAMGGMEIIGFDMIMHEDGPIIVDENTMPGFYLDLFKKSGRDPAVEVYKIIDEAVAAIQDSGKDLAELPREALLYKPATVKRSWWRKGK